MVSHARAGLATDSLVITRPGAGVYRAHHSAGRRHFIVEDDCAPSPRACGDAMLAALHHELPDFTVRAPTGGHYLWLRLPGGSDETALATTVEAGN